MSDAHATKLHSLEDGFFPILRTDREEVATALQEDQLVASPSLAQAVMECDDEMFAHIARKAGDYLIEGGDYYEALRSAAEAVLA